MKFRGRALQKMREPDELDRPIALVDTRGWTALFVVLSIVLGAGIWAFTGSLPVTMSAPGILTSPEGTRAVEAPTAGTVTVASTEPGERVRKGDPLLSISGAGSAPDVITAPVDGTVLTLADAVGEAVAAGETVATIQATGEGPDLVAQVFVPPSRATSVRPGIDVLLEVEGLPATQFGLLKGTVKSVGAFPIDPSMARGIVGSGLTADQLTRSEPTVLVTIELSTDRNTASGFAWTSADGPSFALPAQHQVDVSFRLGDRTPFDVVLGTS